MSEKRDLAGGTWIEYGATSVPGRYPDRFHRAGGGYIDITRAESDALIERCAPGSLSVDEGRDEGETLPEGVHEAPDGTLLWHASVCSLPEGYEAFRNGCWGTMGHDPRHDWWYAVRPVQPPATERVPWGLDLLGRTFVHEPDRPINYLRAPRYFGHADAPSLRLMWETGDADGDGYVEVLAVESGNNR